MTRSPRISRRSPGGMPTPRAPGERSWTASETPAPQPRACARGGVTGLTCRHANGGEQPIEAFAYGTPTMAGVDKIVGRGNRFVAEARRQVAGDVGIDMLAGPTEVLIIADGRAEVRFVAGDLIAQAEHDEDACAWCVTTSPALADALEAELARQVARSPRKAIVERSLAHPGGVVVVSDLDAAVDVAHRRAPQHVA